ncbi:MAG: linear amide C-N hydrolase, partial [Clostridia bacterium]|nr:linear amide C-N hydrolase [Clostridia bacterium]
LSSASRFVRASFTKLNAAKKEDEMGSVTQFFHILSSVEQTEGCVEVEGKLERTAYSACMNCDKGIYYYKTYDNSQITAVDLFKENLDLSSLKTFPLEKTQKIKYLN